MKFPTGSVGMISYQQYVPTTASVLWDGAGKAKVEHLHVKRDNSVSSEQWTLSPAVSRERWLLNKAGLDKKLFLPIKNHIKNLKSPIDILKSFPDFFAVVEFFHRIQFLLIVEPVSLGLIEINPRLHALLFTGIISRHENEHIGITRVGVFIHSENAE